MKYFISLVFLTTILLTSCSNSDDGEAQNPPQDLNVAELVVGQWRRTEILVNGEAQEGPCVTSWRYSFGENGNFGESQLDGSCSFSGNSGIYSVSENIIMISSAFVETQFVVDVINESRFIFSEEFLNDDNVMATRIVTCEKIQN